MDVIAALLELLRLVLVGTAWLLKHAARGLVFTLKVLGLRALRALRPRPTTFGSARWATLWEVLRAGVLGGRGIILGKRAGRLARFNGEGYALLVAPTRSGKGTGVVIPTLLDYPGSVICCDIKGENHAVAGRARAARGPVYTLNLITPGESDRFNPLDIVRIGTIHEADDAEVLADYLVIPDHRSGHWDLRAKQLLAVLIRIVLHPDLPLSSSTRTLGKVAEWLASPVFLREILDHAQRLPSPSLRDGAAAFLSDDPGEELKSVIANAEKAVQPFAADRLAGMLTTNSTFDFRELTQRVATCFVMVEEEKIPIYGRFLRLMMGCMLMALTRAKSAPPPRDPVLMLIDEAAALGRIETLEAGVGYLATYARMLLVFQDLAQLRATYPKAESFIANAGAFVTFNLRDPTSAEYISKALGARTVFAHSAGQSQGNLELIRQQLNSGMAETGRPLLDPAELLRLPRDQALVFLNDDAAPRYPIRVTKLRYFKAWRWRGQWDRWRAVYRPAVSHEVPRPEETLDTPRLPPPPARTGFGHPTP